jgi:hypothetical protein
MPKKFPIIQIMVDGDGQVVDVKNLLGGPLTDNDYDPKEKRRLDKHAVVASENYCRWRLVGGRWVCT